MFIIDELDRVYNGFCNSNNKITYAIVCVLFPPLVVLRLVTTGLYSLLRGGKHKVRMRLVDGMWVVESWYYGKFSFRTEDEANRFCERNHLRVSS